MVNNENGDDYVRIVITKSEEDQQVRLDYENEDNSDIKVKAVFDPSMKWQLVEEYGVNSFEEMPDGKLLFEHEYADDEGLISWMLSCRDKVTVLEPESVRNKMYEIAFEMTKKYERKDKKHGK